MTQVAEIVARSGDARHRAEHLPAQGREASGELYNVEFTTVEAVKAATTMAKNYNQEHQTCDALAPRRTFSRPSIPDSTAKQASRRGKLSDDVRI